MEFRCPPCFILRKLYPGFQWFSYSVLFGIIILGASLTVLLYRNERRAREQWLSVKFHEEAEANLTLLQKTIDRNMDDIATVAALCRASNTVNRQEFSVLTRQLLSRNPCAQALQWLQRVTDAERDDWEAAARREIAPGFQITERNPKRQMVRAARRPEYYAIFYCEPHKGNEPAIGYDPSSEPTRRTALEKSVDTGEAISSDWVHLVQGDGSEQGIVISIPIYRNGQPCRTTEERRRAIKGFAVGVIKVRQVFNVAWGSWRKPGIEILVDDLSAYSALPANYIRLGVPESSDRELADVAPRFKEVQNVKVADHAWRIQFVSTPAFFSQLQRENPLRTPFLGISITAILGAYLYFLLNRAEHARRHARELARSQAELQESRERFAGIITMASDAIISVNEELAIILFNREAERCFGYPAEEVIGWPLGLLLPEAQAGEVGERIRNFAAEAGHGHELNLEKMVHGLRKDGEEFPAEASLSLLTMGGEKILTVILRDKTEALLMESQLRHAQKMEAVGQLAGGVAHDFNNILTVIMGNASILLHKLPPGTKPHDLVEAIHDAGERAAAVTRQLLAFSRKQVLQMKFVNLNRSIDGMRKVLPRLIGEDIQVTTALAPELWTVRADPTQIDQMILNLVVNARDAMPDGGELRIETRNESLPARINTRHSALEAGEYVVLTITDNGTGMDEKTTLRIFEPFFTTKEKGRGTGLGLATVYGVVNQIGGAITVDSRPGQGTTFRIYLPRTQEGEESATRRDAPATTQPAHSRQARILAVEDDDLLRNFVLNSLRHWGFPAQVAASGAEALAICQEQQGRFDLLLTDVVMPGMSGAELAVKINEAYPGIKILFMSGYPRDIKGNRLLEPTESNFIVKPFTAQNLLDKILPLLESSPTEAASTPLGAAPMR